MAWILAIVYADFPRRSEERLVERLTHEVYRSLFEKNVEMNWTKMNHSGRTQIFMPAQFY